MKAVLKYPGGKWRIAEWIIAHFPAHAVYLEPYFGCGAIFFMKAPAGIETVNDLNGDIVNLFRVCRERGEELARLIELTPFSRREYVECYVRSDDPLEQARRTLVRYWQSFGSTDSSKHSWKNSQTKNSPRCPIRFAELPKIILETFSRLREVQIENYDAVSLIKKYDSPDTLIYLDPPYIESTRKKGLYKTDMTDKQHEELLKTIKASKSKICLSAYDNELYNEELKEWETDEKPTTAQMGLHRTEKLYMNYDPPWLLTGGKNNDN